MTEMAPHAMAKIGLHQLRSVPAGVTMWTLVSGDSVCANTDAGSSFSFANRHGPSGAVASVHREDEDDRVRPLRDAGDTAGRP